MTDSTDNARMTAVFACDLRKFNGNPFHQDTPFGRPITTCIGDALEPDPMADARVKALVEALRDIEGRSRPFNPTGNPKWINDHARAALAAFDKGGKDE